MDILQKEITGDPVSITLAGESYPLAFPIFAVALYKQETAKLDRGRMEGKAKLSLEEIRELKKRRRQIIASTDEMGSSEVWVAIEQAGDIRRVLDEHELRGDSLFQVENWFKISEEDPERILLALWAGLHTQQPDETWKAPFTIGQLQRLLDFSNCRELILAVHKALGQYMPKRKEANPNAETLEAIPRVM